MIIRNSDYAPAKRWASFPMDPWTKLKIGRVSSSGAGLNIARKGWMKHKTEVTMPTTECTEVRHSPKWITIIETAEIVSSHVNDIELWWTMNQISFPSSCFPDQNFFMYFAAKIPIEVVPIQATIIKVPWMKTKVFEVEPGVITTGLSSSKRIAELDTARLFWWYPIDDDDAAVPLAIMRK